MLLGVSLWHIGCSLVYRIENFLLKASGDSSRAVPTHWIAIFYPFSISVEAWSTFLLPFQLFLSKFSENLVVFLADIADAKSEVYPMPSHCNFWCWCNVSGLACRWSFKCFLIVSTFILWIAWSLEPVLYKPSKASVTTSKFVSDASLALLFSCPKLLFTHVQAYKIP